MPLTVDNPTAEYKRQEEDWQKCRDFIQGQRAVHDKGEDYLPKLSGMTQEQYDAYKMRTRLYNAAGRTKQGLIGMILRKKPVVDVDNDPNMEAFLEDVTASGVDFYNFTDMALEEVMEVGRYAVLTEYPKVDTQYLSVAEAERLGLRPYWVLYQTEQILGYRQESVNNKSTVTMVRLRQVVERPDPDDEFNTDKIDQVLVLDLVPLNPEEAAEGGLDERVYRQRIYEKHLDDNEKTEWKQVGDDMYPRVDGEYMDEIPISFGGARNTSPVPEKPPLLDLVNVNHDHYLKVADHSNALHIAGLPTPVITGDASDDALYIGTTKVLKLADPQAKAFYMELEGKSLSSLKDELDELKQEMATLGARMLSSDKKQAEAAETAQIHRQGEQSVVASISNTTGTALTKSLFHAALFYQSTSVPNAEMNTDFMPFPMDAQTLTAVVKAWQEGAMAWTDLIGKLKRGEIIEEDRTPDDIKAEVQSERPTGLSNGQVA